MNARQQASPLQTLIEAGSKVWLDSVDPEEIERNRDWGITGATSNPKIIAELIETGRFDDQLQSYFDEGLEDEEIAWKITNNLVTRAEKVFLPVWEQTRGNDGYVSFELDPLLEDPEQQISPGDRTERYIELGQKWSAGHRNRLIKVPNTAAGRDSLQELTARGVNINVTLTFSPQQYAAARDAIWRGAQERDSLDGFKSVYSIFVSRVDVYTHTNLPQMRESVQGQIGIANAKQIWRQNRDFWSEKSLPLEQEIVFASTGTKMPDDPPWKYVEAFAGADIETNPPKTNAQVQKSGRRFGKKIDEPIADEVKHTLDEEFKMKAMEETLMAEGVLKFARPQKELLQLLAQKRADLPLATK